MELREGRGLGRLVVAGGQTGIVVALGAALFAYAVQQTAMFPAVPAIQQEFHTSATWAAWTISGYLLVAAVVTPLGGRLGDQYGKRRVLVIGIGLYLIGSLASAAAPNMAFLIAARALQGAGGVTVPLSSSIVRDELPRHRVAPVIGILFSVVALATSFGVVFAGAIVDAASWRVSFAAGAGLVALGLGLVLLFVPESPIRTSRRHDVPGALLLAAGLVGVLLALTEGEQWGWTSDLTLGVLAAGVGALVAWVVHERRVADPVIDVRMLAQRPVLLTNVSVALWGFAMFGPLQLVPRLVTEDRAPYGFGGTMLQAGLYMTPGFMAGLVTGPIGGRVGRRYGLRYPLAGGAALLAGGCLLLAFMHAEPWQIVAGMLLIGMGWPLGNAAMVNIILAVVRPTETGAATGMLQVLRSVGSSVGTQVFAAILAAETIARTTLPSDRAFTIVFAACAVIAACCICSALLLKPGRARLEAPAVEPLPPG